MLKILSRRCAPAGMRQAGKRTTTAARIRRNQPNTDYSLSPSQSIAATTSSPLLPDMECAWIFALTSPDDMSPFGSFPAGISAGRKEHRPRIPVHVRRPPPIWPSLPGRASLAYWQGRGCRSGRRCRGQIWDTAGLRDFQLHLIEAGTSWWSAPFGADRQPSIPRGTGNLRLRWSIQ